MDVPPAWSFWALFEPFRPHGSFLLQEHVSVQFVNLLCVVIETEWPDPLLKLQDMEVPSRDRVGSSEGVSPFPSAPVKFFLQTVTKAVGCVAKLMNSKRAADGYAPTVPTEQERHKIVFFTCMPC